MEGIDIRPAEEKDLSSILQLYQLSLGNTEGMRTEVYWRWKHEQNPFGRSPVLLAWKDNQLVGMRAFMRWRFQYQGKSFLAYRAVDTATHPQFQGKGIFSKLTMALVNQIQSGEPALIFNTPNAQSKPGYLKMGWKIFGKMPLQLHVSPFNFMQRLGGSVPEIGCTWSESEMAGMLDNWTQTHRDIVHTDYSVPYLHWRYKQIPILSYQCKVESRNNSSVCIIYRVKKTKYVRELRVNDVFYLGPEAKQLICDNLIQVNRQHKPDVMTILTDSHSLVRQALPFGYFKANSLGLAITCREVNDRQLMGLAQQPARWSLSAGTLELF